MKEVKNEQDGSARVSTDTLERKPYSAPRLMHLNHPEHEAGKNGSPVEVGDPFGTGAIGPS